MFPRSVDRLVEKCGFLVKGSIYLVFIRNVTFYAAIPRCKSLKYYLNPVESVSGTEQLPSKSIDIVQQSL